uniref:hypothetical protein n=1 Tax=Shewanella sp. TaxID=50422 RepID=UPI0040470F87
MSIEKTNSNSTTDTSPIQCRLTEIHNRSGEFEVADKEQNVYSFDGNDIIELIINGEKIEDKFFKSSLTNPNNTETICVSYKLDNTSNNIQLTAKAQKIWSPPTQCAPFPAGIVLCLITVFLLALPFVTTL